MGQPETRQTPSQMYRLLLTGSILLFLATLTGVILVIILANAQERDQQRAFEVTLTAIAKNSFRGQVEFTTTPQRVLSITPGEFPFALREGSLVFSGDASCDEQTLVGQLVNDTGAPVDGFAVLVWGDYVAPSIRHTGEIAGQATGAWALTVAGDINRRMWVQVVAEGRYLSEPVEILFDGDDCTRNRANLVLAQTAPLP